MAFKIELVFCPKFCWKFLLNVGFFIVKLDNCTKYKDNKGHKQDLMEVDKVHSYKVSL